MSKVVVVVSVDWEGRSLLEENLQLMIGFREKHSDVPIQHFLNAAYYTRQNADVERTTGFIQKTLLPIDEHGLHIHAWASLVAAAGVSPRNTPRFLEGDPPVPKAPDDWEYFPAEAGYDVSLESFEPHELDRLLRTSIEILSSHGFREPTTFRAGAWLSGPRVQDALARGRFAADCSAVDPQLSVRRFGDIPLCRWLLQMWPTTVGTTQPYQVDTPSGVVWQIPNNAGLVDYTSTEDLIEIFNRNIALWLESPSTYRIISTGFHQETARKFLNRLDESIPLMREIADQRGVPLVFSARPQDYVTKGHA